MAYEWDYTIKHDDWSVILKSYVKYAMFHKHL